MIRTPQHKEKIRPLAKRARRDKGEKVGEEPGRSTLGRRSASTGVEGSEALAGNAASRCCDLGAHCCFPADNPTA